ncbi:BON domain-containing protein [Anabaena sp. AL93]|jgi:antitoxin (DNA-binding transcriptional repressor) of toxin-antitoxin stability system|uniref:BON domain-containing protein n=1 Tax=Anabaena sp. AL93 TaxID=1678133 RepID=UPI0007FDE655|nr:BON domain-containing protein [Anabaena sp. AL93]MCX5983554.1 BON domain-containing protein [Nostocales cyanobacterium LacPavin_0920_SED1_MAG_38_18]OBQ22139.1 MAG: transporter [Anabaena sp. AL93]
MKKLIPFLVSGVLVAGMVGCQEAPKTGSETTGTSSTTPVLPAKPASDTTRIIDNSTATPTTTSKSTTDLKTEISKKLKTVLPGNKLEITNKDGEIILKGTATSQKEITQAETFIKAIPGVKSVKLEAIVKTDKKP